MSVPVAIASANIANLALRRDQPAAILGGAQERREASSGVEPRNAKPIDRAIAADQRSRFAIADQRIIFDS